ncbi:MAG: hypothetical protein LBG94_11430 [Treponema sp.]|jgi:hypothetical protein|nr:hypothetical protein [Treponema sp.]
MRALSLFILLLNSYGIVYSQSETQLIYREVITYNEPRLSILAVIENDTVKNYILSNELFNSPYFLIELTEHNLVNFREALSKFFEWESLSIENNLDSFKREIPITVVSKNVTWSWINTRHLTNVDPMIFSFQFDWNPARREEYRALLHIDSNTLQPMTEFGSSFTLNKYGMNHEAVEQLFENITEEKISDVFDQYRKDALEKERQRELIEELFR